MLLAVIITMEIFFQTKVEIHCFLCSFVEFLEIFWLISIFADLGIDPKN